MHGNKKSEGDHRREKRNGIWLRFYEGGERASQVSYLNGILHGKAITWYQNGKKASEGSYVNGLTSNDWIYWDENDQMIE